MQRIVITGASAGIGAALARNYADHGATLGLIARRQAPLAEFASGTNTPLATYAADVRDSSALQAAAADFIRRFGAPDIVIANAGVSVGTKPRDDSARGHHLIWVICRCTRWGL